MSVDPATAKHKAEHAGETLLFLLAPAAAKNSSPTPRDSSRSRLTRRRAAAHDTHVHRACSAAPSKARARRARSTPARCIPQIRQDQPGRLPDLRHGAGAGESPRKRRARTRNSIDMTRRFWVALALSIPVFAPRNGRPSCRPAQRSCRNGFPTGFSSRSRRRSRSGRAGRSSSAAGRRSRAAISTCSR